MLGELRRESDVLRRGDVAVTAAGGGSVTLERRLGGKTAEITVNVREKWWSVGGERYDV